MNSSESDPGSACYMVRNDCELCQQLQECGFCATHNRRAGACNPAGVSELCESIGGEWNVPCREVNVAAPTPVATVTRMDEMTKTFFAPTPKVIFIGFSFFVFDFI